MAVQLKKKLTNRLYNPLKIRDTLDMYLFSDHPAFYVSRLSDCFSLMKLLYFI